MGIGSLVYIINMLIAPIGNVLMKLGCQGKGTEDFIIVEAILVPGNSFLYCSTSFKRDTTFHKIYLMHRMCTKTLI